KMRRFCAAILLAFSVTAGCAKEKIIDNTGLIDPGGPGTTISVNVRTDKAAYNPGDAIRFTIDKSLPAGARVRYKQDGTIISDGPVTGTTWTWNAPSTDFTGYMAELYATENGKEMIYGTIALDVSSNPARFP